MAELLAERWEPSWDGAGSWRARRGGTFHPYLPDELIGRPLLFDGELATLAELAADAERAVRRMSATRWAPLESVARFLLRSEALASSQIEGLMVSPQQVALAELAGEEGLSQRGLSVNARLVANNITTVRAAVTTLVRADAITVDGIEALHRALLPDERHHGCRAVQNWIGGSDYGPLDASFVPPPPDRVQRLMRDLAGYASGALHAPLIQAGLLHAQFETIHPFTDGNGRVGRALIHTVLTRRGLTSEAVLPISLVLLTRSDTYVHELMAYRYVGPPGSRAAQQGMARWLTMFLEAARVAVDQAERFFTDMLDLRDRWTDRVTEHRERAGLKPLRRGSTAQWLLRLLPEAPVLTARTAQELVQVSFPAARKALEELADAGVLRRRQIDRGTTAYLAPEVFELITFTERRLASTRWDTREARPNRAVPARPGD
jgi:Fic family protein